jgi:CheY-like chemotaxis protein/HPt (histidine-containing phosphotransfer) domain-containing protein
MGSDINVRSTPGKGTTFWFSLTLPLADYLPTPETNDSALFSEFRTRIAALGRPLRILITDDNPTNRLVAAKILQDFPTQTNTASDGNEAVTAATRFSYDVILMDVRMPEMDGLEATRAIRAKGGRLQTVPIIAFTANVFAEDATACREAGMTDIVSKPVRKKSLIETILRVLPRQTEEVAVAEPTETAPPLAPDTIAMAGTTLAIPRETFAAMAEEIGEDSVQEIAAVFVADTETRLALFDTLTTEADRRTIEREAHSLKSAAATFGLTELSATARDLEKSAHCIDATDYVTAVARLRELFAAARAAQPLSESLVLLPV